MGNPLITDTFHANRWDYLYSLQPGGGQRQQERMSLFFNDNGQLASLSGDFMPGVSRDQEILGADAASTPAQPQATPRQPEQSHSHGSLEEQIQREVDAVEAIPVPTPEPLDSDPR